MQVQSSHWRQNSGAPLCIPPLLSDLILAKLGLHMDVLLMEHRAAKSLVPPQEVRVPHS